MMARQEEIKTQRRRRNSDALQGKRRRLQVQEDQLDRENFEYRFANDTGDRLHQLTVNDDWEVVSDRDGKTKPDGTGTGSEISVRAGGFDAVLLRKPKHFYDEDYAASQRRIDELDKAIQSGATPNGDTEGQYVPDRAASPMRVDVRERG